MFKKLIIHLLNKFCVIYKEIRLHVKFEKCRLTVLMNFFNKSLICFIIVCPSSNWYRYSDTIDIKYLDWVSDPPQGLVSDWATGALTPETLSMYL